MPNATRAVRRSSQKTTRATETSLASDAAVIRAASFSGHSSSNESLESGRERRRRGKQKMQTRILELERRVQTLLAIIHQLAPSNTNHGTSTVLFDVFDLADDTASVGCQTDISVDLRYPDVFIRAQDISGKEADAAAGLCSGSSPDGDNVSSKPDREPAIALPPWNPSADFTLQIQAMNQFAATTTGLRNLTSVSQDVGTWQALDDTNARHQVHDMQTQCGPLPQDFNSQDLADTSEHLEVVTPSSGMCHLSVSHEVGTWRALDDTNAKHQMPDMQTKYGPLPQDSNSQDLANSSVSELEVANPSSGPDTTALYFGPSAHVDFNSQNLASPSELLVENQRQKDVGTWQALDDTHAKHQVPDMQTQCGPLPQDFSSQALADSSEHLEVVTPSSGMCQLPGVSHDVGTWQALDDTNAKHQVPDEQTKYGPLPQDFNSQGHANSSVSELEVVTPSSRPGTTALSFGPSALELQKAREPRQTSLSGFIGAVSPQQSLDTAPTSELVQDFEHTLDNIIDIFNRRRKVSSGVLKSTVSSARGAAAMRGIDIMAYRTYIQSRAPSLSASIFAADGSVPY